jgi:hypothetical protein
MDASQPHALSSATPQAAQVPVARWSRLALLVVPAVIILLVVGYQASRFSAINFRDDEIRTVHAGLTLTPAEVVQWMSVDIHPPFWRVLATGWVRLFGVDEAVARFSSVLTLALALAVFTRAMRDLFDGWVTVLALVVLGTHALVLYYGHELRPYAALLLWTNALHFLYIRWLRKPGLRYALLYVLAGAAALYTHFFALYVIAAQAVALVLLVRPARGVLLRGLALFLLIGLAFAGWLPSFLHSFLVTKPGGVDYGIRDGGQSLTAIYSVLQVQPSPLANLLQGLAVLVPLPLLAGRQTRDARVFRFAASWPKWYWLLVAAVALGGALVTNRWVDVLTQRNLILVVPALATLTALGLRALPWPAALVGLLLLVGPSFTDFPAFERILPFREVADVITPDYVTGTPIVLSVDDGTGDYFAFAYTLMDRLPGTMIQDELLVLTEGQPRVNLPEPIRDPITASSPPALARMAALVDSAAEVWWVTSGYEPDYAADFRDALERDFVLADQTVIAASDRYPTGYRVDRYVRR